MAEAGFLVCVEYTMGILSIFGLPVSVTLIDAAGASFVAVPLYTYDRSRKEREQRQGLHRAFGKTGSVGGSSLSESEWLAVHDLLGAHVEAVPTDIRWVCAVPQGAWGVQLCELSAEQVANATLDERHGEVLSPLFDNRGSLSKILEIAAVIRGDAAELVVSYQKEGEEPASRRIKPTALFQSKRKGLPRHEWPIAVICDDIDKGEAGKTCMLDRMLEVDATGAGAPLSFPADDNDIPF